MNFRFVPDSMKRIVVGLFVVMNFFNSVQVQATTTTLSQNSKIYLLTVLPGNEIYTVFGHSAFRISDPINRIDRIYNFGTFDFDTPFFYLKFIKGNLMYQLSESDYEQEKLIWPYEQRTVYEQELNISLQERQNIFNNLESMYNSDARYYRYNFFFDNCATRIRDVIEKSLNDKIIYDTTGYSGKTFRELIYPYIKQNYWLDAGINTALGKETDRTADTREYMFLPKFVMQIYARSRLVRDNDTISFTSQPKIIFMGDNSYISKRSQGKYIPWLIVTFLIILTIYETYRKKHFRYIDILIQIIYGLTGLMLSFFWIYSLHNALYDNFNLVWANPLNLILAYFILKNYRQKLIFYYSLVSIICIICLFLFRNFIPQNIPVELLPIVLIISISMLRNILYYFRKTGKQLA